MRIIRADELRAIGFEDLIEPVAEAFRASSTGRASSGFLTLYPLSDRTRGDIFVKTGAINDAPLCIVKIAPWFAVNVAHSAPQGGLIAVLDGHSGHTLALLDDAHYLSDIRTAAAGALAARYLVPGTVTTAAVIGAGAQAFWQVLALRHERFFERLLIWARRHDAAEALKARLSAQLPGTAIVCAERIETVINQADVIINATLARDPVLCGNWLRPGQHVTSVGADDPSKCELDAAALNRARVFVDDRATALANGNVYRAVSNQQYDGNKIAGELGDLIAGGCKGRESDDDITIASLVGIGAQDVAAASVAIKRLAAPVSD